MRIQNTTFYLRLSIEELSTSPKFEMALDVICYIAFLFIIALIIIASNIGFIYKFLLLVLAFIIIFALCEMAYELWKESVEKEELNIPISEYIREAVKKVTFWFEKYASRERSEKEYTPVEKMIVRNRSYAKSSIGTKVLIDNDAIFQQIQPWDYVSDQLILPRNNLP